jgi:peptidoglycan/xylan/chitin deacetylase (PgdA/CDA1 family)
MSPALHNICFHGVGDPRRRLEPGERDYWVSRDAFLRLLDELADRSTVRISFDDGNASDVDIALDALVERGLSAAFFVLAGRLGTPGSVDADGVRELRARGMTIGTHGMDHRPWTDLAPADRDRELVEARAVLADVARAPVTEAALPLGLYDRKLLSDLARLGYTSVYTSDRRLARSGAWLQPRFSIRHDDTVETVRETALATPSRARTLALAARGFLKRLR